MSDRDIPHIGYGVPREAILDGPRVQWNHIDGPLLEWAGRIHWLTWRETIAIWLRFTSVDDVAARRFPRLTVARDLLRAEIILTSQDPPTTP